MRMLQLFPAEMLLINTKKLMTISMTAYLSWSRNAVISTVAATALYAQEPLVSGGMSPWLV